MEVSKQDWKLFQEKIGKWQETYMEKLNVIEAYNRWKLINNVEEA